VSKASLDAVLAAGALAVVGFELEQAG